MNAIDVLVELGAAASCEEKVKILHRYCGGVDTYEPITPNDLDECIVCKSGYEAGELDIEATVANLCYKGFVRRRELNAS